MNNKLFEVNLFFVAITIYLPFSSGEIFVINSQNETVSIISYNAYLSVVSSDIRAYLVEPHHPTSCRHNLSGPPSGPNFDPSYKWFAILPAACSFNDQIQRAIDADYDGLILYHLPGQQFQALYFLNKKTIQPYIQWDTTSPIPVLMVSKFDGPRLVEDFQYFTNHTLYIISHPFNYGAFILPIAILIGLLGISLFLFILFKIMRLIRENRRNNKSRLSKKNLKMIPTTKFKKGDHYDVCAVCLEEYIEGEKLRVLSCSHAYHLKCIDPWLTKNRKVCPVCKSPVRIPGVHNDSDSDEENSSSDRSNERTPLLSSSTNTSSNSNNIPQNYGTRNIVNIPVNVEIMPTPSQRGPSLNWEDSEHESITI